MCTYECQGAQGTIGIWGLGAQKYILYLMCLKVFHNIHEHHLVKQYFFNSGLQLRILKQGGQNSNSIDLLNVVNVFCEKPLNALNKIDIWERQAPRALWRHRHPGAQKYVFT